MDVYSLNSELEVIMYIVFREHRSTMDTHLSVGLLVAILLTIIITHSQCSTDTDMRYIKICNETSPISLTTMNEVLINKKLSQEDSSDFQCFLHCLFTKYGWMDEDGGFLLTDIRSALEEAAVDTSLLEFVLYKCTAIPSVDRCHRAFQFTECFWEKVKEHQPEEDETFVYTLEDVKK